MARVTPQKKAQRRKRFVKEYLKDLNATAAAQRAGSKAKTRMSAAVVGHDMLQEPEVKAALAAEEAKHIERIDISVEHVLREIHRLAMSDPRRLLNADGSVKPPSEWDDGDAAFVAGFDVEELYSGHGDDKCQIGVIKKLKLWNKPQALEMLGKHLALFVNKLELTGSSGGPISLDAHVSADLEAHVHGLTNDQLRKEVERIVAQAQSGAAKDPA